MIYASGVSAPRMRRRPKTKFHRRNKDCVDAGKRDFGCDQSLAHLFPAFWDEAFAAAGKEKDCER